MTKFKVDTLVKPDRKIVEERSMDVIKSNDLIQKTRHSLNVEEQKIILYLISKIKPEDKELLEYDFSIKEFCEILGINLDSGKTYAYIKNTILELTTKAFWLDVGDGKEVTARWVDRGEFQKGSGQIKLTLDKYLMPYLLHLKKHFTKYSLYYTIAMKSQYSIRLYELLKSYQNLKEKTFTIRELKIRLNAEHYKTFNDFKKRALEPALKEIELYTDLDIKFEFIKNGRRYEKITFFIGQKKDSIQTIENVQYSLGECCPWER